MKIIKNKTYEIWRFVEVTNEWVIDKIGNASEIAKRQRELQEKNIPNYIRAKASNI